MGGNRTLRISFDTPESFRAEYASSLCNGGAFIATDDEFALRETVRVEVQLCYQHRAIGFESEVVHIVPPEMAQMGGRAGVAVQFKGKASDVRATLERLVGETLPPPAPPPPPRPEAASRATARTTARVAALIESDGAVIEGRTRNLSRSGVLVSVAAADLPVGRPVQITLTHPISGERMTVAGRVAREVRSQGEVSALAFEFTPDEAERDRVGHFVEAIQETEHTRRLGGITGAIQEIGPQDLIQMFATTATRGTLYLRNGHDEGMVGFDSGLIRYIQLGAATGMKALMRMIDWREGSFEFQARLEDVEEVEAPLPLQAALLDATRRLDEQKRDATRRFSLDMRFNVNDASDALTSSLTKVEDAVIDLARAGFTVQRMLDVIPEPDPEIFRALDSLADQAVLVPADRP
jgi:Tfp pilus assembly protein PilZ